MAVIQLNNGAWVGIDASVLCFDGALGCGRDVDPENPVGLLPLLEEEYSCVISRVQGREEELGVEPGAVLSLLPLVSLLRVAVASGMDYWAGLAVRWIEELPNLQEGIQLLRAVEEAAWASQSTCHAARGARKRIAGSAEG
jgi:hypothetical protein